MQKGAVAMLCIVFLLLAGTLFSCKNNNSKDNDDTVTRILYIGDFGAGCDFGLYALEGPPHPWTGNPTYSETLFAENLPDEYKVSGIKVKVSYRCTDKEFTCNTSSFLLIHIIKIERL